MNKDREIMTRKKCICITGGTSLSGIHLVATFVGN